MRKPPGVLLLYGFSPWLRDSHGAWLRMAPLWLLVVGFFACHVTFEALNEALVTIPGVPKSGSAWHRAT